MTACLICDTRDARHRYACPPCVRQTQRQLRELETYSRLLDAWFTIPTVAGVTGPVTAGFHSQPPADLATIVMLDRRSDCRVRGVDDDIDPLWSIPGRLRHLSNWLLDVLDETPPRRRSITGDIAYTLSKIDRAASDKWIQQLAEIVDTVWRQARGRAHDRPPPPAGECLTVGCGGIVYRAFLKEDDGTPYKFQREPGGRFTIRREEGARCGTCQRVYKGRDLVRLGAAQAAA